MLLWGDTGSAHRRVSYPFGTPRFWGGLWFLVSFYHNTRAAILSLPFSEYAWNVVSLAVETWLARNEVALDLFSFAQITNKVDRMSYVGRMCVLLKYKIDRVISYQARAVRSLFFPTSFSGRLVALELSVELIARSLVCRCIWVFVVAWNKSDVEGPEKPGRRNHLATAVFAAHT